MKNLILLGVMALLCLVTKYSQAQNILIDRAQRINGLWVFPLATDNQTYLYLPQTARLGKAANGLPEFSNLRYVLQTDAGKEVNQVITEAGGGALVHFLVQYHTEKNTIRRAEQVLRQRNNNKNISIRGPVIFDSGNFALISSILTSNGKKKSEVLALKSAPILEGNKLAYSFKLNPEDAKILLESFKMSTSDVSLVFELGFSGYADAYDAEIFVDWSLVYQQQDELSKTNALFTQSEVRKQMKSLFRNQAIRIKTRGTSKVSQKLVDLATEKVMEMVFEKVNYKDFAKKTTADEVIEVGNAAMDRLEGMMSFGIANLGSQSTYAYKKISQTGITRINFNHAPLVKRTHHIAYNLHNIYEQYGDNPLIFKTVNLLDPDYMQRDIFINLDGDLQPEFGKLINTVQVEIRKNHANGRTTLQPYRIQRQSFVEGTPAINYLNQGDFDEQFKERELLDWFKYEYRTIWNFKGNAQLTTPWKVSSEDVNLFVPYEKRNVILIGDLDEVWLTGAQSVVIELSYQFFNEKRTKRIVLRPSDNLAEQLISYTAPLGNYDYEYRICYVHDNDSPFTAPRRGNNGVIVLY